jgi:hypothetical protein
MKIELNVDVEHRESTSEPWWIIIDPTQIMRTDKDAKKT